MKGLAELIAENAALVARARKREAASIRRLKQRIKRMLTWPGDPHRYVLLDINAAIDAWQAAERGRGS